MPSPSPRNFSLQKLIGLVSAVILCFSLYKSLGWFGLAWGLGFAAVALGWLVSNRRTVAAGLTCISLFPLLLAFGFWQFGSVQHSGSTYLHHLKWGAATIPKQLERHKSATGTYPDSLDEMSGNPLDAEFFAYQKTNAGKYRLTYLGEDKTPGGVGVNADCTAVSRASVLSSRVPFSQFFVGHPVRLLGICFALFAVICTAESLTWLGNSGRPLQSAIWKHLLENIVWALPLGLAATYGLLTFAAAVYAR